MQHKFHVQLANMGPQKVLVHQHAVDCAPRDFMGPLPDSLLFLAVDCVTLDFIALLAALPQLNLIALLVVIVHLALRFLYLVL